MLSGDGANVGQYTLNANIFEGLVRMDPSYGIVPVLATSWNLRGENTWRFVLRRGVKMHDGQPFSAKSVKYSFDRIADQGGGTPGFAKDGTKIVDEYTVDVTPSFPNTRLVEQIVHPQNYIIAAESDPVKKPTGTGGFEGRSGSGWPAAMCLRLGCQSRNRTGMQIARSRNTGRTTIPTVTQLLPHATAVFWLLAVAS
ncbi:MAG: ABC transporter substrate-binding protein [Solirubrobacteraceae bacterium]